MPDLERVGSGFIVGNWGFEVMGGRIEAADVEGSMLGIAGW